MKYALPLILGAFALSACGQQADAPAIQHDGAHTAAAEPVQVEPDTAGPVTVVAEDAWCRPSPNGAKAGGCYVILTATGNDTLTSVSSSAADIAQVHEMKHEDGMMKMAHLANGLPLVAGQRAELKPHGTHIMLMGLKAPLVEGQTAKIDFNFAKAAPISVEFAIRTPPVTGGDQ